MLFVYLEIKMNLIHVFAVVSFEFCSWMFIPDIHPYYQIYREYYDLHLYLSNYFG